MTENNNEEFDIKDAKLNDFSKPDNAIVQQDYVPEKFEIVEVDDFFVNLTKHNWLKSKKLILKNLLIIGLAWVFLFTAYGSAANLQSSLNSDEGLGTAACK